MKQHGDGNRCVAFDRADLLFSRAAERVSPLIHDAKPLIERARAIKSVAEIRALTASLRTAEAAIVDMREKIKPGMKESEALALLIGGSIARGGEYPETCLMTSGPRTNPWFQETSERRMQEGDLLAFDTDLIGPGGFYNDISRAWTIGETRPTDAQRRVYAIAYQQLEHNMNLLRPGMEFLEYSDKAFQLPAAFIENLCRCRAWMRP